ncbi:hypothetical protein ACSSS7_002676 [Eimeria intestinalis]
MTTECWTFSTAALGFNAPECGLHRPRGSAKPSVISLLTEGLTCPHTLLLLILSCGSGLVRMDRVISTATRGPTDLTSTSAEPIPPDKDHGLPHADCLRDVTGTKEGVGGCGIHGISLHDLKSTLLIHVLIIGLMIISLCIQRPKSRGRLRRGMQRRRLAGGGQDSDDAREEPGPPVSDYSELCRELGPWIPLNPLPGEPRSSPTFVESYFSSLDQGSPSSPGEPRSSRTFVGSYFSSLDQSARSSPGEPRSSPEIVESYFSSLDQSVGRSPAQTSPPVYAPNLEGLLRAGPKAGEERSLEKESPHDDAAPGPSWKVARTIAPSAAGQLPQSQLLPAASSSALFSSSGLAPKSSGPAAGVAPPQVLGSGANAQHPFLRLPTLEPGVRTRQFLAGEMRKKESSPRSSASALRGMRELFRKQSLGKVEAFELLTCAESLARHAYHWQREEVDFLRPVVAATHLGQRFMIAHYLFCASQVLGQNWPGQLWWGELMGRIPHHYFYDIESVPQASHFHVGLAKDLSYALAQFKRGVRPPPRVILDLMRRLICSPNSPWTFKKKHWNLWREDDARYTQ